jgi:hypothetical protein
LLVNFSKCEHFWNKYLNIFFLVRMKIQKDFFFKQQILLYNQILVQDEQRSVKQEIQIKAPYIGRTPKNKHPKNTHEDNTYQNTRHHLKQTPLKRPL